MQEALNLTILGQKLVETGRLLKIKIYFGVPRIHKVKN